MKKTLRGGIKLRNMDAKKFNFNSEKILCLWIFLSFFSQAFSQTSSVIGENVATPEEIKENKRIQKLQDEILIKENAVKKLMNESDLHYASAFPYYLNEFDKKEKLNDVIKKNQNLYSRANTAQFHSMCNDINSKYSQLNKKPTVPCTWLKKIRKISKENINKAKKGIANIGKKKKKTASKVNNIENDINELDNALGAINESSSSNKKAIRDYNNSYKEKSIDDFLKTNSKSKNKSKINDFLSSSTNNENKKKGNDFLSGISKPPAFSDSDASKGYKIDYKNSSQGVLDIAGNILIPYKNWKIKEYKDGIAKVSIEIDSYQNSCSSKAYGSIYANAYKTGFVDKSTRFIDGYKITFRGGFQSRYTGLIIQRGTDNRSYEEKQASKRRYEKRRRLARKECEAKFYEWKTSIINRYK